jgi:hypothetical protein
VRTRLKCPSQPWADLPNVLELAKRKNAVIKVSGACTLSQKPYPFPDIWDPLKRVFGAWGAWTAACGEPTGRAAVVNYEQATEPFLQIDRLSDPERSMDGACAMTYGWSPKKALRGAHKPRRRRGPGGDGVRGALILAVVVDAAIGGALVLADFIGCRFRLPRAPALIHLFT